MTASTRNFGECIVTQHHDPETGAHSLAVDRADPVILISADLLRDVFATADPLWYAQVRLAEIIPYEDIYLGATLRITGTNRVVVYRITSRHDECTYVGEWPD